MNDKATINAKVMVVFNFHVINILPAYISNCFYFGEFEGAAGKVYLNRI